MDPNDVKTASPDASEWRFFLFRSFAVLGAGSLLASVVCFIAYNWHHMGPLFKLGLVELLMAGLALLAWRLGFEGWKGPLALFGSAFLVGPLLAIFGQAYPTGAPLSKLLFIWAAVCALAALLSRLEGIWILSLTVLNAAFLYWDAFNGHGTFFFLGGSARFVATGSLDLAAYGLTFLLSDWIPSRLGRRLLAFSGASFLNIAFVWDVFDRASDVRVSFFIFPVVVAAMGYWAAQKKDLFLLVVALLGAFSIVNTLLLKAMGESMWFFLTVLNLGAGGFATRVLNQLHRKWKDLS